MSEQIPEGWKKIKLGEVGKFSTSSVDKKSSIDEQEVFLLNYMDVYNHSILRGNYPFQRVTAPTKQISSSSVQQGDVFFTPSSETPDDVGHSAVFIGDKQNLVHSYHTVRFRPSSDVYLDDEFKSYAFKGAKTYEHFRIRATGSTRFTVSLPVFNDLEITIPPLPEQKKIASILTSVDEVIETTKKQIDKLQDLKKAMMNELLTKGIGHTEFKDSELGRIPKSWEVKKLESLINLLTDFEANGSFADVKANVKVYDHFEFAWYVRATDLENNTPLSKVKYVDELTYNFLRKTQLSDEEILIAKRGEIGKVYFYRNRGLPATAAPNTYLLRLNELCDPFYLFCYLTSTDGVKRLKQINASTTIGALYKNDVKSFKILVPSKEEQQQISKIILSFDDKLKNCEAKIAQTQALKKSLMQDLLTGKVRVQVN